MRLVLRFLLAHVIASFFLQSTLLVWVIIEGGKPTMLRGVLAVLCSPIIVPLPLFRIGPKMRPLGYALYLAMYLTLLAAASFVLIWRNRQRQQRVRIRKGQCAQCGYDLRASTERCPECGTAVPAEVRARSAGLPSR